MLPDLDRPRALLKSNVLAVVVHLYLDASQACDNIVEPPVDPIKTFMGFVPGSDEEDWHRAEHELRHRLRIAIASAT